ncbi:MAG TPA: copper homeostasis membrane protein CopD [Novosphingobium sp.]
MLEEQLIVARWCLYLSLGLLFGLPLFSLYTPQWSQMPGPVRLRTPLALFAIVGLLVSVWGYLVTTAGMMGVPLLSLDRATLGLVTLETAVGWAFVVRVVALLVVLALACASRAGGRATVPAITAMAALAIATLAWSGHGVATEGMAGWIHLASDVIHLLAASAWLGALAALLWAAATTRGGSAESLHGLHRALDGFAVSGSVIVGLIVLTGLVNGALLFGVEGGWKLGASIYGQLLILKLALFAAMLALAASNRFRLTPAIGAGIDGGSAALARLRQSVALEAATGVAILGLVAWLGTLEPPASG